LTRFLFLTSNLSLSVRIARHAFRVIQLKIIAFGEHLFDYQHAAKHAAAQFHPAQASVLHLQLTKSLPMSFIAVIIL